MVLYPAVYVVLTLPIAIGRMVAMTGTPMPDVFFCIAGSLLTSCGWIDALLYALTRRILVSNEVSSAHYNRTVATTVNTSHTARPGDFEHYGLMSMDKENKPARSVTIVGGNNALSRMVDNRLGRSLTRKSPMDSLREDSPTGSQDSIIKTGPLSDGITVQVETNIHVEMASVDSGDTITPTGVECHYPTMPHAR